MSYGYVSVDCIAETVTKGTTPTSIGYDFSPEGIPFLRVNNIQDGLLDTKDVLYINIETNKALSRSVIQPNDVLLSIAGTIGRSTVVPSESPQMNCNQAVAIIRLSNKVDPYYFSLWLNTDEAFRQISGSKVTGTISNLSLGCIKKLKLPLPPLEEQKRIAAILDKADAIRRSRKQAIRLTEELLRSTFLDMFGDPVTNPKGWKTIIMSEVISQIEAGWSAKGEERRCSTDEWGVLKISAVTSGTFNPQEHKAVDNPNFNKTLIVPRRGDLLFSRANTRELVAATCLVENDCERLFLPDKLWRIKTNTNIANVEYLRFLLADPKYRSLLARQATGTSGSMLNVSQAKLLGMYTPVPELDIQQKFADVVWRTYKLKERNETFLFGLNLNFNSLLQKAFRGEL
jgi:type I restriction enzyme, S subunit